MSVAIATTPDELLALRADWLAVRSRCSRPTANGDPDRFRAAIATMQGVADPYVAIFYVDDEPLGAIVAKIERRAISCALGYIRVPTPRLRCLDVVYGGMMADEALLPAEHLVSHLQAHVQDGLVDLVFVDHVRVGSRLYTALVTAGAKATDLSRHWRFQLVPGSFEQTISCLSTKHRRNMRREDRLLLEHFGGDVQLRAFTRPEELDEFVRVAAELNSHTYQAGLGIGFTDSPLWRSVLGVEAERGRMRCYWLQCGGKPIAFQVAVLYGQTYFGEFVAYLPDYARLSPGSALHVRVIRDLCEIGVKEIDYGIGHAEYKQTYGTASWDESNLCLYGVGLRTSLSRSLHTSMRWANRVALEVARAAGIERRLRRAWRNCLGRRGGTGDEAIPP